VLVGLSGQESVVSHFALGFPVFVSFVLSLHVLGLAVLVINIQLLKLQLHNGIG
jgi:hypothetical protein